MYYLVAEELIGLYHIMLNEHNEALVPWCGRGLIKP